VVTHVWTFETVRSMMLRDKIGSEEILILLREDSITEDIKVSQSNWKQHVLRMFPYRYLGEASFCKLYWYTKLGSLPKQDGRNS
jgi:hypothetical protein